MAIKEIKREWSPCQCGYVKTFLLHSEADVANLPKCCVGSKAIVSETDNEYLCTADGWKNSASFDDNGGAKATVILPETVLTMIAENAAFAFMTINAMPEKGKTYTLTYNGVAYDSVCSVWFDGAETQLTMGNSEIVDGGNPDAPFAVMFYAIPQEIDEIGTVCGVVQCMDSPTSVTLSIVEKVETESAGGGSGGLFIATATLTGELAGNSETDMAVTLDKSFAEISSAFKSGNNVVIEFHDFFDPGDHWRIPLYVINEVAGDGCIYAGGPTINVHCSPDGNNYIGFITSE